MRRGAGAVDRDGLENRCTFTRTVGSNPTLSANYPDKPVLRLCLPAEKCVVSEGFGVRPVDRQGCNEGRNRVSDGRLSPDLWTGVIWYASRKRNRNKGL